MLSLSLLIIGFIALSGVLAMIDAAVLSVTRAEVESMADKGLYGAQTLRYIKKNMTRAVVVIVILTNVINVLGPIIVGYEAVEIFGSAIIGIVTAVLTFGTIVFSEIIPKSLGSQNAPLISRIVAPLIRVCIIALYPVVIVLERLTALFQSGSRAVGTEDQVRSLVRLGRRAGFIRQDEDQLIQRAFLLNDRTVEQVMTPQVYVATVSLSATIREAAQTVFQHRFSRYPVMESSDGPVVGLVMSSDILQALSEGRDATKVSMITRVVLTIEPDMPCSELLPLFRARHTHMAIVERDGKPFGVITLEDVLEELVGNIEDEYDDARKLFAKRST